MKRNAIGRITISASKGAYIYFALLLLLVPLRLLFAAAVSAAVHELFHVAALCAMRIPVYSVRLGVMGAKIETGMIDEKQELLCAIAGPMGGFSLLLLFRWLPVIALTGAIQSLYNLLPLYPTDGGRVLRSVMSLILPHRASCRAIYVIEIIVLSGITAACAFVSYRFHMGILPVIFAAGLLIKSAKGNNSCKA